MNAVRRPGLRRPALRRRSLRRSGRAWALATALAAATVAAMGAPRTFGSETKGRLALRAHLEPADLGPGGKGSLVVTATLDDLIVYAESDAALTWRALPAAGVTYATPETPVTYAQKPASVEMTAPSSADGVAGESYPRWRERFELKVPVEIARDASPSVTLGLSFAYSACDPTTCYTRRKDHRVTATLGAPPEAAAPDVSPAEASAAGPAFPVVEGESIDAASPAASLSWTRVETVERLQQEVAAAAKAGKPVVVTLTAPWCTYCKRYTELIDEEADLREGFSGLVRLEIDVGEDPRTDLRAALGIGPEQPRLTFFDRQGRLQRGLDVTRWYEGKEKSALALRRRLMRLLGSS